MTVQSMLAAVFTEIAEGLGVPWEWVAATSFVVIALSGHFLVRVLLTRLYRVTERSRQQWDDALVGALQSPIRLAWWLLMFSLLFAMLPTLEPFRRVALQLFHASLVLLVPWFLHRLIANVETQLLTTKLADGGSVDKATVRSTARLMRIALWLVAVLMLLQTLGVSVSGLLAFGGIGGIAIGFAARDLLANFFGGLSIHMDRPFTIGDWVRSPDRSIEGTVEDIGWRMTTIRTFDKRPLYVPNSLFSTIAIENPTRMANRRIYESFGLRYEDSHVLEKVIGDVHQMLLDHEAIDKRQTVIVNFTSFGESSLDCFLYCLTVTTNWVEYHSIKQDVMLRVLKIVHDNGADIAFPTRTLQWEGPAPEPSAPEKSASAPAPSMLGPSK